MGCSQGSASKLKKQLQQYHIVTVSQCDIHVKGFLKSLYCCSIRQAKSADFLLENQISTTTDILRVHAKPKKYRYRNPISHDTKIPPLNLRNRIWEFCPLQPSTGYYWIIGLTHIPSGYRPISGRWLFGPVFAAGKYKQND